MAPDCPVFWGLSQASGSKKLSEGLPHGPRRDTGTCSLARALRPDSAFLRRLAYAGARFGPRFVIEHSPKFFGTAFALALPETRQRVLNNLRRVKGQRSFFKNFTLWYDDGKFNARVSYQGQSEFFDFISSCSNAINNYPTSFAQCPGQTIRTPYNPGGTNFRDATEFWDLKVSYQFTDNFSAYFTGRNITRELTYRNVQPNNVYSDGAPTLEQNANAAWKKLLDSYEDPGLDPAIDEELQAYMAKRRLDPVIEEDESVTD